MTSILVVDDDSFDSSLIAKSLKSVCHDADIIIVNDSTQAVEQFRSLKPSLALLDISMPGMNGFEVLEAFRACPERQQCSVVMLSGSTDPADRERASSLGADGYRVKPSQLAKYYELAQDLLN